MQKYINGIFGQLNAIETVINVSMEQNWKENDSFHLDFLLNNQDAVRATAITIYNELL